jgi:hypothetical protein
MKGTIAGAAIALMFLAASVAIPVRATTDDQFGYSFDPDLLPSGTQGLKASYSISNTGVSLTCPSGWIGVVDTLTVNGGTPQEYLLQGYVGLGCNSGVQEWNIFAAWYDNNGLYQELNSIWITSGSSYSGTISIDYTGSAWELVVYVSQIPYTYTYSFGSAGGGSTADGAKETWTAVETDAYQTGVYFSSQFTWQMQSPQFLVSSAWQTWNVVGANYKELIVYAVYKPMGTPNSVGELPMSTPGVNVAVGSHYNDRQQMAWCISGSCPLRP